MKMVELEGEMVSISEASRRTGISISALNGRLSRGQDLFNHRHTYKAGDKFHRLTLLEPVYPNALSKDWVMRCDCGELTKAGACNARLGRVKSCGCLQRDVMQELQYGKARTDLSGRKYNKLTVLRQIENISVYYAGCVWECECDCGNIVNVPTSRLTTGHTKSCGCLKEATQSAEFMELIRPIAKKKYLDYHMQMEEV